MMGPLSLSREMVLASAGSGKTFHLSSRFIGILALGEEPEAIWASTFTRKAAGEILERVLLRLAKGALQEDEAEALARHAWMGDPLSLPPGFLSREHCGLLLLRVLRSLHRANIGTLDSFFARVATAFSEELGLPPGWGMVDFTEEDRIRSDALDAVLALHDPAVTAALVRIMTRGEVRRRVHGHLLERVDELLRLERALPPGLEGGWRPVLSRVPERPTRSREEVGGICEEWAAEVEQMAPPLNKNSSPNKAWAGELSRLAGAIRVREWEALFAVGVGKKLVEGGCLNAPADVVYSRHSLPPALVPILEGVVELAREELGREIIRQGEALGRMARRYREAFEKAQRASGRYRFEDITHRLGRMDPLRDRDAVYFRLDARIRHLLLDEFQDTSLPQWRVLEPLAQEILGQSEGDRAGVLVADPKQSIYGWRGARPGLVKRIRDDYQLPVRELPFSFRSSPVILDTVYRVFGGLAENPVTREMPEGGAVAETWLRDFYPQEAHDTRRPGFARLVVGPGKDGEGAVQGGILDFAADLVGDLTEREPRASIGVLVRNNKVVSYLMATLRQRGIGASGEGGTPLTDAAPVNALLALLRMADHPGDRLARYHVAHTPLGGMVGFTEYREGGEARRMALSLRGRLLREGYGRVLDEWAQELGPFCDLREGARVRQLVELGFRWDRNRSLRPSDFIRFVEGEGVEDPSGAGVRVMTVHQAKGLEFDVVVLPNLYERLGGRGVGSPALPLRDEVTEEVVGIYPYRAEGTRAFFPELQEAHGQERSARLRDEFSTLYVAMTRARYALHMVVPADGERGPGNAKSGARLLREALSPGEPADAPGKILYEIGTEDWSRGMSLQDLGGGEREGGVPGRPAPSPVLLKPSTGARRKNLARLSPSSLEGGEELDLAVHLSLEGRGDSLLRGTVVHAWCELLGWWEDGLPSDESLFLVGKREAPGLGDSKLQGWLSDFRAWTAAPGIQEHLARRFFERAHPSASLRLERELPFLHRTGEGMLQGYVDRLVVVESGGGVVSALVQDFKTDRVDPSDSKVLEERVAYYRPQIRAYRQAVAARYGLDLEDVGGELLFLRPGVVLEV